MQLIYVTNNDSDDIIYATTYENNIPLTASQFSASIVKQHTAV